VLCILRRLRVAKRRVEPSGVILQMDPKQNTDDVFEAALQVPGLGSQRAISRALDTKSTGDMKPTRHSKSYRCSDPGDGEIKPVIQIFASDRGRPLELKAGVFDALPDKRFDFGKTVLESLRESRRRLFVVRFVDHLVLPVKSVSREVSVVGSGRRLKFHQGREANRALAEAPDSCKDLMFPPS
jgi:hypothetical protein